MEMATAPVEQRHAELALKLAQGRTQRLLAEVELLGGTCGIELLGDLDKRLESAEIERHDWSASAAKEMVHIRVLSATAPDLTQ